MQLLDVFAESAAGMKAVSSTGIAQILADGYVFLFFLFFFWFCAFWSIFVPLSLSARGKKFPVHTVRGLFSVLFEVEHECMCEITNRALKWFLLVLLYSVKSDKEHINRPPRLTYTPVTVFLRTLRRNHSTRKSMPLFAVYICPDNAHRCSKWQTKQQPLFCPLPQSPGH